MRLTLRETLTALNGPADTEGPESQPRSPGGESPHPRPLSQNWERGGSAAEGVGAGLTFTGISTDTRTLQPGDLFVALRNEKADGHEFVPQAIKAGAAGLIVSRSVVASRDVPLIRVEDTQVAYGLLARFWRDRFDIPVVGVTGSVGKTTTKEMLAAALSPLGPVLKTEASQNGETGVPKTLLGLTEAHRAAVIEMGMRGRHQIDYLCGLARPTAGVLTLIGDNHIELLGSREAIADAKGELLTWLPGNGLAVLNADDAFVDRLRALSEARVVTYGVTYEADCRAEDITRTETGWAFTVRGVAVALPSPSRHDISNALAALAVAGDLGVPLAEAADALRAYAAPPGRMQVVPTGWGGTVLDDAFNAAPASMRSALETLRHVPGGRRIAFLGDMRELGDHAEAAHRELGDVIRSLGGLDALYTVGGLAALIPDAVARFSDSEQAAAFARRSLPLQPGDVVLVKGSHAVAMEKVVEALKERA